MNNIVCSIDVTRNSFGLWLTEREGNENTHLINHLTAEYFPLSVLANEFYSETHNVLNKLKPLNDHPTTFHNILQRGRVVA